MKVQLLGQWADIAKIVGAIVAIGALMLGSGFFYNEIWHVPQLVYSILATYEVEGQHFSGLVVENRGRATAHDVMVKLSDLPTTIEALTIQSSEMWDLRQGGKGTDNVTVWLDRMVPDSSVTVYMLSTELLPLEQHITITAEEGKAMSAADKQKADQRTAYLAILTGLLLGVGSSVLMIIWVLAPLRDRLSEQTERIRRQTQSLEELDKKLRGLDE